MLMLSARSASARIALRSWSAEQSAIRRYASNRSGPSDRPGSNSFRRRNRESGPVRPGKIEREAIRERSRRQAEQPAEDKPSLIEQLFPEESRRYEEAQRAAREVPRLPVKEVIEPAPEEQPKPNASPQYGWVPKNIQKAPSSETAVLVLRNASPNLTEEDFRRLIPQGKHIEGWTLKQADFQKVVPGRDLTDLAHQGVYYLIFSSPLSAYTFQGHVMRIHRLASTYLPNSVTSPAPPAPGHMIEDINVHAALEAYAIVAPGQKLELALLKRPMSPLMDAIARNQGIPSVVNRAGKMPFEVRLTLEGPQLGPSAVRHMLMESAKQRGLNWSGAERENSNLKIDRWDPERHISAVDKSDYALRNVMDRTEGDQLFRDQARKMRSDALDNELGLKRRTPGAVYILGFYTEKAARSFVSHWSCVPLPIVGSDPEDVEGDLPPIINAEYLW